MVCASGRSMVASHHVAASFVARVDGGGEPFLVECDLVFRHAGLERGALGEPGEFAQAVEPLALRIVHAEFGEQVEHFVKLNGIDRDRRSSNPRDSRSATARAPSSSAMRSALSATRRPHRR